MNASTYTPGRMAQNDSARWHVECDGEPVASCIGPNGEGQKAQENARRLVACWNACVSIPTDELQRMLPGALNAAPRALLERCESFIAGFEDDDDQEGVPELLADLHAVTIPARLEHLRGELRAERISYAELAELQSLASHIDPADTELLEAAGVPEADAR